MDEMLQSVRETKEEANLRKKDILNLLKMVKGALTAFHILNAVLGCCR